ncbi:hypothetical protein BS78_K079000 [Paspalum vaginatum]|uniref:Uncharacterized protein n=1 Tax=Paspalum vaginatum TaxID=158149 RepID=A0A9W7XCP8_9POAL|nr:hypothetical protein BS78_K079000 [Paspalum vaginatum]
MSADDVSGQLPIRIVSRRLVKASDQSIEPYRAAFCNLDLLYTNNSQWFMVCLYPNNSNLSKAAIDFDGVVASFETGLPSLLSHFYPLTGRIVNGPSSGVPELHCDNQGAELVVAEVDVTLASLDYGVATESLQKMKLRFPEDHAFSVQLLSFACGGCAVVWGANHLVCDGYSVSTVVRTWSELAWAGKIAGAAARPSFDSVFRPRDPPSYGAMFDGLYTPYDDDRLVNVLTAHDCLVERLYYVEASDLAWLRDMASAGGQRASRVQAVSAYIWKALAAVAAASRVTGARCRMGWWVNGRPRLTAPDPELVRDFFGNVTTYAPADAAVEEIQRRPLAEVAAMVREATTTSADEYGVYVQELIDWMEQHKTETMVETTALGFGSPTVNVTVMASFAMDTDFGLGQAALAMPVFDYGRLSTGLVWVSAASGANAGSWLINTCVWPRLAAALESEFDGHRIFKPLTAEYLGLVVQEAHRT